MHLAASNSSIGAIAANTGSPRAVKLADPATHAASRTGTSTATVTNHDCCWVNLNTGKPVPGPDEWRALERRASLFRLR